MLSYNGFIVLQIICHFICFEMKIETTKYLFLKTYIC